MIGPVEPCRTPSSPEARRLGLVRSATDVVRTAIGREGGTLIVVNGGGNRAYAVDAARCARVHRCITSGGAFVALQRGSCGPRPARQRRLRPYPQR